MLSTDSKSSVSKHVPQRSIAEPAIAPAAKLGGGFLLIKKIYNYIRKRCKV